MTDTPRGLFSSVRSLAAHALELLQNRVELLLTEIEEEKERLLRTLALGAAAFFLLGAGLIYLSIFLTVLFWDEHRLLVLGLLTAFFLGTGLLALWGARRQARRKSRLLGSSLGELTRDRAALQTPPP